MISTTMQASIRFTVNLYELSVKMLSFPHQLQSTYQNRAKAQCSVGWQRDW